MTFQDLKVGDIFQTDSEEYYIKINLTNGFNSILLTGKEAECHYFNDDVEVSKF